jgi:hypothetical protein
MLRGIFLKSQKYVINVFSNCAFNVKIIFKLLCNFYAALKYWLQEVKSPYTYFSCVILIPNFYDV